MWYGIGNTVIANPSSMTVGLRANGRFMLYNGAVDIGQGTYTVMPQIVRRRAGRAGGADRPDHRRHRPDARRGQELGVAADLRVGQRRAPRRRGPAGEVAGAARSRGHATRARQRSRCGARHWWPRRRSGRGRAPRSRAGDARRGRTRRRRGGLRLLRSAHRGARRATDRACRTRPTGSRRSSPRSRSIATSAPCACWRSTRRTTSGARSIRPRSKARSTAGSRRASASR